MTQYLNPKKDDTDKTKRPQEEELDSNGRPQSENQAKGGQMRSSLGGGKVRGDAVPVDRPDEKIQETNIH